MLKEILIGGRSKKSNSYHIGDMVQADDGNTYIVVDTEPYYFENIRKRVNEEVGFVSLFLRFFWVISNMGHQSNKIWEIVRYTENKSVVQSK